MSEAEVSLRLAFHLLSYPASTNKCVVAIDGAQVQVHGEEVFPLLEFITSNGWVMAAQSGKNAWQGQYKKAGQSLLITAQSGKGDVVATIGSRRVRAESKKGPLVRKKGSPEYPLMREAIGQLMTVEEVETNDVLVVAIPQTEAFRNLASRWRERPLLEATDIHFALVGRDGSVEGLPGFLRSEGGTTTPTPTCQLKEGRYRHYEGDQYIVVGFARHSETEEEMVVYRQDFGERGLLVHSKAKFLDSVKVDGK
jgi:hypothetical protein